MVEKEKKGKKDFKWKAEFSMGELDYGRFNEILKAVDEFGFRVKNGESDSIKPYYASLHQLYTNWRVYILKTKTEDLDAKFFEVERLLGDVDYQRMNSVIPDGKLLGEAVRLLKEINTELIELKQTIGLGIPLVKERSEKSKVDSYLN